MVQRAELRNRWAALQTGMPHAARQDIPFRKQHAMPQSGWGAFAGVESKVNLRLLRQLRDARRGRLQNRPPGTGRRASGRASCRDRECQYVSSAVVAVYLQKKIK